MPFQKGNRFGTGTKGFLGKHHSEETKRKISKSTMGHPPNVGMTGKKHSPETIKKFKEAQKGEKHWRWKGGISTSKEYKREYARNIRKAVLDILGGKCNRCGFDDYRALQIDHINGDGYIERTKGKGFGSDYSKRVMQSFLNGENKYQLLCANCNWIKRVENKEMYIKQ